MGEGFFCGCLFWGFFWFWKMQALAMLSSDTYFYRLWSRASYPGLDDRISRSYLVVHSIGIVVLVLLASLTISYRQVIHAYPQGEGPTW